jgi:hypothetical protein
MKTKVTKKRDFAKTQKILKICIWIFSRIFLKFRDQKQQVSIPKKPSNVCLKKKISQKPRIFYVPEIFKNYRFLDFKNFQVYNEYRFLKNPSTYVFFDPDQKIQKLRVSENFDFFYYYGIS